ncbi:TolC family protein [Stieleria sp. TO1_6]|uniref:TolC family protein n=1 Tax=Stieleria tagensis TaxID=2956795 RepID=UPI00209BAB89|nr:TolC family protein [Stieleria tagensis]MCO8122005.1 TolC family protein [Stieleria tagensis]
MCFHRAGRHALIVLTLLSVQPLWSGGGSAWGQSALVPSAATGRRFLPPPSPPAAADGWEQLDPNTESEPGNSASGLTAAIGMSLQDVLTLAAENNPTLRQARLQVSAQTATALQAGLYPNPTLAYSGEQIGVDTAGDTDTAGEFQGMILSQRFVTAGKLGLSREKYLRRAHVSEHLAIAQQFRVCNDVRIHFYRTLAAGQIVAIRRELLETAEDAGVTARELYNLGQASRPDVRRSNISLQRARLAVLKSENQYRESFRQLTAIVGVDLSIEPLQGRLMPDQPAVGYDEAWGRILAQSPELLAARAKLAADRVTVQREQVEWVPDIVAGGGAGYNFEAKETTATAGITIELPVFDRNQGTIRQAQMDLRRQEQEIRRTELELQQRLADVYQRYLTSLQMVTEYERVIVPESRLAYQELLQSYKDNRVDWPSVLEAQHDYFDVRLTQIEQLQELRSQEVLVRGFLLHGGLMAAPGPTPVGHIDSVPKPR